MPNEAPDVAFLGIAERAYQIRKDPQHLWHTQILGLRSVVISSMYPLSAPQLWFVLAIYDAFEFDPVKIAVVGEDGRDAFSFDLAIGGSRRGTPRAVPRMLGPGELMRWVTPKPRPGPRSQSSHPRGWCQNQANTPSCSAAAIRRRH